MIAYIQIALCLFAILVMIAIGLAYRINDALIDRVEDERERRREENKNE